MLFSRGEGAHPLNKLVTSLEMWINLDKNLASVLIPMFTLMLMGMMECSYTDKQCVIIISKNCSDMYTPAVKASYFVIWGTFYSKRSRNIFKVMIISPLRF